jgi:hypothetical protein
MTSAIINEAPTYLDAVAIEFKEKFDENLDTIKKLCKSNKASSSFFTGENGFLADLISCFRQQGIPQFQANVKPELTQNRELPLTEFLNVIIELPKDKLKVLKSFHSNISDESHQKQGFPPEYSKIADYFSSQNRSSNESAEAGRLILTLSSIGDMVLELKGLFEEYTPRTIGHIQKVLKKATAKMTNSMLTQTDDIRRTIRKMIKNFSGQDLQLIELKRCVSMLKVQKREFAKLVIVASTMLDKSHGDKIFQSQRNIRTWIEWEELVNEDPQAASQIENQGFAKCLSSFKNELNDYVSNLQNWSVRVQHSIQAKEAISPLFINVLSNVDQLVQSAFTSKMHIEPSMRLTLKKLQSCIQGMRASFKTNISRAENELKKFPEPVAKRLSYLNSEIPKVLMRSNPNEVKMMTVVINASYKNVEQSIKSMKLGKPSTEIKQMANDVHHYYTTIVKNATKLIKVSPVTE